MDRRRRSHVAALIALWLCLATAALAADDQRLERLTVAGPPAAVSYPLIELVESGALDALARRVEFVSWRDPDQVRALILRDEVDLVALPSNVAANLYNRGVEIRLVNISAWGLLWLLSRDPDIARLEDLAGAEIVVPFRGDMPDIILGELLARNGLDVRSDVRLRYVASPMDAMQLIIMRRASHAVLSEPAASMALEKTASGMTGLIAPDLHRAIDLQSAWATAFERDARIPQAGIVAVGPLPEPVIEAFANAYADALERLLADPGRAAGQIVAALPMLTETAAVEAITHSRLEAVAATEAREALEFFYRILEQRSPALIGGRLPDSGFYFTPRPPGP